jgi:pyruvate, water dikinase
MSERHIIDLIAGADGDVAELGGKGAGLAGMIRRELPVPPAFVVSTKAFRTAVGTSAGRVDDRLDGLDADDPAFAGHCARARAEVYEASAAATGLLDEIAAAYDRLDPAGGGVAVRSSSAAEDSGNASFAGEHDSYLWVGGRDAVIERVRACWAGLYTERAVRYRRRTGVRGDAMAVVVQRMVDARAAGVLMTLNPVSGDRSVIVVESVFGLGEPLVSAEVTPDRFVLDKVTGEIRRRETVEQPRRLTGSAGRGTRWEPVPEPGAPSLSDAELGRLRELGRELERGAGHPVDVEFAVDGDRIHLLQVRPETVWSRTGPSPEPAVPAAAGAVHLVLATLTAR